MSDIARQFRIVGRSGLLTVRQPSTLLYPLCMGVLWVGAFVAILGGLVALAMAPSLADASIPVVSTLAEFSGLLVVLLVVLYLVIVPAAVLSLNVAFAHELRELGHDRRPTPFEGLAVAAGMLPQIVGLGVLVVAGFFASTYVTSYLTRSRTMNEGVQVAYGTVTTFLAPALVTHDGSIRDVFTGCVETIQETWQTAAISTVGVRIVTKVIVLLGFVVMIGLPIAWYFDVLLGGTNLALVVGLAVSGFLLAAFTAATVTTLVNGVVSTALYIYAREGELPSGLGDDPEALLEQ